MQAASSFSPSHGSRQQSGLRLQLTIAFGLLVAIFLLALMLTLAGTLRVRQITQQTLVDQHLSRLASEVAIQTLLCRRYEKDIFLNMGDQASQSDYRTKWNDAFARLDRAVTAFSAAAVTDADRQQADVWRTESAMYMSAFMKVDRAISDRQLATPQAANAGLTPFKESIRTLTDTAVATARNKDMLVQQAGVNLDAASASNIWLSVTVGFFALIVALASALFFPARLIKPLIELRRAASQLARADLSARATVDRRDEFGELAASFNEMASTIQQRTDELEQQYTATEAARVEAENARAAITRQLATIEEQRTAIREMSMPILPLTGAALVMPLIGSLDSARLRMIQEQVLRKLERSAVRVLILDVTGVPIIDEVVGQGLLDVIRAARLLGTEVVLVGIRPEIAQTIVGLGIPLGSVVTQRTLEDGIIYALNRH